MTSQKFVRSGNLVKVMILEPIYLDDETVESLRFRIEIFQWSHDIFTCKLWLEETYLLKPRFQTETLEWDVKTCVLEHGLPWKEIQEGSLESALDAVVKLIQDTFSVTVDHPLTITNENTDYSFQDDTLT